MRTLRERGYRDDLADPIVKMEEQGPRPSPHEERFGARWGQYERHRRA